MREKILERLIQGKEMYNMLISKYSGMLPPNIIDGAVRSYEEGLPDKINNFLGILNSLENTDKFVTIKNVDEAISTFKDTNIQLSIDNANTYNGTKIFTDLAGKEIAPIELLDQIESRIKYDVINFNDLIKLGRIEAQDSF